MGFAASQARYMMLTARRSDLELQLQFIQQARMQVANVTGALFNNSTNLDPENPEVKRIQQQTQSLQQVDKNLEMQSKRIEMQREAIVTEVDAVKKVLQTNIQSSFKTFNA